MVTKSAPKRPPARLYSRKPSVKKTNAKGSLISKRRRVFTTGHTIHTVHITKETLHFLRLGIIFLACILLLICIKNIYLSIKQSLWDGKSQILVAYEYGGNLGVVKFDPLLQEADVVNFPQQMYLPLAMGYQSYRVDKIKALAVQENISFGNLLTKSITTSIGVLTDGYIIGANGEQFNLRSLLWQSVLHPERSNLTAWDKLRLFVFVSRLKVNEIKQYKAEEEFLQKNTLADGSEVLVINENVLNTFVLQELSNPAFLQERFTWELFNATDRDGLANSMRRIVANSGFDVSGIRQALDTRESSTLYVSDHEHINENILMFANFFNFPIVVDAAFTQRTDIALYLGEDYWMKFFTNK